MGYLASVLHQTGKIDLCIGFSPTDESNETLQNFIPRSLIYSDFDESVFDRLILIQRKRLKQKKERKNILIIMDDLGYHSKEVFKSTTMKNIFYNGRHMGINILFSLQYLVDLPPNFRTNVDIAITLRENVTLNREKLYKVTFELLVDLGSIVR